MRRSRKLTMYGATLLTLAVGASCQTALSAVTAVGSCTVTNAEGVFPCVDVVSSEPGVGQVRYEPGTEVTYSAGDLSNGASFSLRAHYGDLGVKTYARSHASQLPFRPSSVGLSALSVSLAFASFDDVIHVTSDTLALGAPVQLLMTIRLTGTSSGEAPLNTSLASAIAIAELESTAWIYGAGSGQAIGGTLCDVIGHDMQSGCTDLSGGSREVTVEVPTVIGASLQLVGSLQARSFTSAEVLLNCECSTFPSSQVDAFNSARVFLDAPFSEVRLMSASSHDYASPVPEPSMWLLMLLGSGIVSVNRIVRRTKVRLAIYNLVYGDCDVAATKAPGVI